MNVKQWSKRTQSFFRQKGFNVTVSKVREAQGTHVMVRYTFADGWSCAEPFSTSGNDPFAYRVAVRHIIKRYNGDQNA